MYEAPDRSGNIYGATGVFIWHLEHINGVPEKACPFVHRLGSG
jgi:hypothetical protein